MRPSPFAPCAPVEFFLPGFFAVGKGCASSRLTCDPTIHTTLSLSIARPLHPTQRAFRKSIQTLKVFKQARIYNGVR